MPSWRKKVQYRVAGLPNALRSHKDTPEPLRTLRRAYRRFYWNPRSMRDWSALLGALVAWPFLLGYYALESTAVNGRAIHARTGKRPARQFAEQIATYFQASILPPWYYIFSLHDRSANESSRKFLNRFETKLGLYDIVNASGRSPLTDKSAFADHCRAHGLPNVSVLLRIADGAVTPNEATAEALPNIDLFVKPVAARGGTGAERWDNIGAGRFRNPDGDVRTAEELLDALRGSSRGRALLVQPRLINHPDLANLSNGALCTVRVLTCLDAEGRPEPVAAAYRMAIGTNVTVDNLHAGGIAAAVDIATGRLSQASDLGRNAKIGWLTKHPQTGAQIEGTTLPMWADVLALVRNAHSAFADRVMLGWDVALLAEGPILVEGNARPDLDIIQRTQRRPLGDSRVAELLAHHVARRRG